ncbi:hypothetical protein [Brevundimonas sp. DC300-4]|uniref:hypothetical protein n=1 Tax=unclassified Brevundimonas TaxID=2622653 RepID=UPI003CEB6A59
MTMRFYTVTLERNGERRDVRVPSPTDVQAADAAAPLMKAGESIISITEVEDDGLQQADALPPKSQAAEFAPVTPGAAAAPDR